MEGMRLWRLSIESMDSIESIDKENYVRGRGSADALMVFLEEGIDSASDAGVLGRRCLDINTESCIAQRLRRALSETGEYALALLEVGIVVAEDVDPCRCKEHIHVEVLLLRFGEIVFDGAVEYARNDGDTVACKHLDDVIVVNVGHDHEELVVGPALHHRDEFLHLVVGSEEDLALAVLDIFLQVVGHGLGDAIVVLRVGDVDAHLLAEVEEMVNTEA